MPIGPSPAKITALLTRGADPVRTNPTVKNWRLGINKPFGDHLARSVCKLVKSEIYPLISFKQRHNAKYKTDIILDTLAHLAMTKDFANNGVKTFRINSIKSCQQIPHPDTILYHLRKLNPEEILAQFERVFDKIYRMAKKRRKFRNKVDLAIDFTDWLYYGNERDPMVLGTQPKKGTHLAYKFATINVVESGQRFTLLALPISDYSEMKNVVERLLIYAKHKVKIRRVYLDRWFYRVDMIRVLKKHGLKFIIQAPVRGTEIKESMRKGKTPLCFDHEMMLGGTPRERESVKLFIVDSHWGAGKRVCFATNLDVNEGNANHFAELFRKRWGIETSYRVEGIFRPKTTSKTYSVRLFYFSFSVCLYNLWVLANIFMGVIFTQTQGRLLITAKGFGTLLYKIGDGG